MDTRKICKLTALGVLLAIPFAQPSDAVTLNWRDYMEGIEIITQEGVDIKSPSRYINLVNPLGNLNSVDQTPVTWGAFISSMSRVTGMTENSLANLLRVNLRLREPLVMTKDEIANQYITLIELVNQESINLNGQAQIRRDVYGFGINRNYYITRELDALMNNVNNYSVRNGVLREIKTVKLIEIRSNGVGVFDVINRGEVNQRISLPLEIRTEWSRKNTVYKATIENNRILALENSEQINYGLVVQTSEGLKVAGEILNEEKSNVTAGSFIEYVKLGDELVVLENLGTPKVHIASSIRDKFLIDSKGGRISLENKRFMSETGELKGHSDLKHGSVVSLFGNDTVVISGTPKESTLSFLDNHVVIEGVMYNYDGVYISDGRTMKLAKDWGNKNWIPKGKVQFDPLGRPKVINIEQMLFPSLVISTGSGEVELASSEIKMYKYSESLNKRLGLGSMTTVVVYEDEIVDFLLPPKTSAVLRIMSEDTIYTNRDNYSIDKETPVVINEGSKDTSDKDDNRSRLNSEFKTTTYSQILEDREYEGRSVDVILDGNKVLLLYIK